jgi:anaerobic selenocysteine-containing dehydrogenase
LPDADVPFLFTTVRVLYHWHGGKLNRRSHALSAGSPEPLVAISPDNAARLHITIGFPVCITSRRGEMLARASLAGRFL